MSLWVCAKEQFVFCAESLSVFNRPPSIESFYRCLGQTWDKHFQPPTLFVLIACPMKKINKYFVIITYFFFQGVNLKVLISFVNHFKIFLFQDNKKIIFWKISNVIFHVYCHVTRNKSALPWSRYVIAISINSGWSDD